MTKEEFNDTVKIGDIVEIIGTDEPVQCVVMTKTEYSCNLLTTDKNKGDDGIVRPIASYYRTYDEVIRKVGENINLYLEYKFNQIDCYIEDLKETCEQLKILYKHESTN